MKPTLQGSAPPAGRYDVALLDLDGVAYVGLQAVPHAASALAAAQDLGMRRAYVTNNAARPPETVAAHLRELGIPAQTSEVVTSAQAAARVVAGLVPPGSAVLVVGGAGLDVALSEHGLRPVRSLEDEPAAVVQGFSPDIGWALLTEGALGVTRGLPWIASNLDLTVPIARGRAPGNGALVGVIRATTGAEPLVAGKPELPLHQESIRRSRARTPLVVGDRLDTDIEGAVRAGTDSLLVFTGVTGIPELLAAAAHERPTYLGLDLCALLEPHPEVVVTPRGWLCEGWCIAVHGARAQVIGRGPNPLDGVRALAAASWSGTETGTLAIPDSAGEPSVVLGEQLLHQARAGHTPLPGAAR
jgi:HAD superfamily hydrolase (TIGR01450 family)